MLYGILRWHGWHRSCYSLSLFNRSIRFEALNVYHLCLHVIKSGFASLLGNPGSARRAVSSRMVFDTAISLPDKPQCVLFMGFLSLKQVLSPKPWLCELFWKIFFVLRASSRQSPCVFIKTHVTRISLLRIVSFPFRLHVIQNQDWFAWLCVAQKEVEIRGAKGTFCGNHSWFRLKFTNSSIQNRFCIHSAIPKGIQTQSSFVSGLPGIKTLNSRYCGISNWPSFRVKKPHRRHKNPSLVRKPFTFIFLSCFCFAFHWIMFFRRYRRVTCIDDSQSRLCPWRNLSRSAHLPVLFCQTISSLSSSLF